MKRIIVCIMSTALLLVWSAVTRAEMDKQRPTDGGDIAEAIAGGATTDEQKQRLLEMLLGKDAGKQSPQPGGTTQPWQTSWEAFCAELKRLYDEAVPPPEEIDTIFAGKQVTWEGNIADIDEGKKLIRLRMLDCRVTTGADRISAQVVPPVLSFENQSEMNQSLNQIGLGNPETWFQKALERKEAYELFTQKIRFTVMLEPLDLKVTKLPAVSWEHFTDKKEGFERYQISIYTGHAKLLGPASGSSH